MNITIKHTSLGEITIHGKLCKEVGELIGDIVDDYSSFTSYGKYFHANIIKNEDNTYTISQLKVVKAEPINVGYMNNSKGNKNFVTIITHRLIEEEIIVYPAGIVAVYQ